MAKRPIELALESLLQDIEGPPLLREDFLESLRILHRAILRGTLQYSVSRYPLLTISGTTLVSGNTIISSALFILEFLGKVKEFLSELWNRFLFGANYDRAYRGRQDSFLKADAAFGDIFTPELLAGLEQKELLLETGRGLSVTSASALSREGI
jgi:hypothetical protein